MNDGGENVRSFSRYDPFLSLSILKTLGHEASASPAPDNSPKEPEIVDIFDTDKLMKTITEPLHKSESAVFAGKRVVILNFQFSTALVFR